MAKHLGTLRLVEIRLYLDVCLRDRRYVLGDLSPERNACHAGYLDVLIQFFINKVSLLI